MERAEQSFRDETIVLAGASSGIGLATAEAAADRGATLVLAARDPDGLEEAAGKVRQRGGTVHAVPTDVAVPGQVEALAERALEATGRLDGWVNLAATSVYGTVEEVTAEEFEQVLRVTFLGVVHGCKAAVPRMRAHGGGVIVNVASVLGVRAVPMASAYSAAKHAVVGFTDALRMELQREGGTVRVGLVLPSSIDTTFFSRARSRMGVEPGPFPPVYAPAIVAEAILHSLRYPQRRLFVGGAGRALDVTQRLSPALTDWVLAGPGRVFDRQRTALPDDGVDSVDEPSGTEGQVSDRHRVVLSSSPWTRLVEQAPGRVAEVLSRALGRR